MRIENRYYAKPWVKSWMFYICVPWLVVKDVFTVHKRIKMDMDDILFEWKFGDTE